MDIVRKQLDELKEYLTVRRTITLTCHFRPDGDAIGSVLGLYHILKKDHEVSIIVPSEYPQFLAWMPGIENIVTYSEDTLDVCEEILNDTEVLFCLDFSGLSRVGDFESLITDRDFKYVMIDHHLDPQDFDDYRYWSNEAAATCQLIYQLAEEWKILRKVSKDAATCLYTGILTDTGNFKHSNTTAEIHRIASKLILKGAKNAEINQKLYDTNTEERLKLLGHALVNKMVVLKDKKVAYIVIDQKDHEMFDIQSGDTEGLVNFALSLHGIVFASLISWSDKLIKLSLRSKGEFPANEVAGKYFSGGGHRNASGGKSETTIEEAVAKFLEAVDEFQPQLQTEFDKLYAE